MAPLKTQPNKTEQRDVFYLIHAQFKCLNNLGDFSKQATQLAPAETPTDVTIFRTELVGAVMPPVAGGLGLIEFVFPKCRLLGYQ